MRGLALSPLALVLAALASCSGDSGSGSGFKIINASPGVVQGGDSAVAWTVTGAGYEPGTTVALAHAGVTIANVTVVSSTQITFELSAATNIANGLPQLTLTRPDSTTASVPIPAIVQTVTLSGVVQPIFTPECATASCHSGGSPAAGLDLSAGATFAATVNVSSTQVPSLKLVAPGAPDTSYMVDKVEGTQTSGVRMPFDTSGLDILQMTLIRKWVEAGALNN